MTPTTMLRTLTGGISISIGAGDPVHVATFELPLSTRVSSTNEHTINLVVETEPASLNSAIADALRQLADSIDPVPADAPVDLQPAELELGFVIVHCPSCDTTQVGRPGDALEHAEGGAHVWHPSYGAGAGS